MLLPHAASGGSAAGRGFAADFARTSDTLDNHCHRQFSDAKDAIPNRVATFQLIKSATLATILLPVVEKVMRRIT
jgi:hypothetical protein